MYTVFRDFSKVILTLFLPFTLTLDPNPLRKVTALYLGIIDIQVIVKAMVIEDPIQREYTD